MVKCTCGKKIDKVPNWLFDVKVDFVCNNCPNRQTKNIAFITLEPTQPKAGAMDADFSEDDDEAEAE